MVVVLTKCWHAFSRAKVDPKKTAGGTREFVLGGDGDAGGETWGGRSRRWRRRRPRRRRRRHNVKVDVPVSLLLSPKLAPAFSAVCRGALKARMRAADDSCFFKGDRVRLINLKGRSDLNGCEGEILTGDPSSSQEDMRYAVRVLRGAAAEEILVRPKNMIDWLEESSSAPAEAPPAVQTARTAAAEGLISSQPAPSSSLPAAAPAAAAAVAAPAAPAAAAAAVAAAAVELGWKATALPGEPRPGPGMSCLTGAKP